MDCPFIYHHQELADWGPKIRGDYGHEESDDSNDADNVCGEQNNQQKDQCRRRRRRSRDSLGRRMIVHLCRGMEVIKRGFSQSAKRSKTMEETGEEKVLLAR